MLIRAFSFCPTTLQTAGSCVRALQLPSIETVVERARNHLSGRFHFAQKLVNHLNKKIKNKSRKSLIINKIQITLFKINTT
jgi:hypothetical protein